MRKESKMIKRMLAFLLTFAMMFTGIGWGSITSKAGKDDGSVVVNGSVGELYFSDMTVNANPSQISIYSGSVTYTVDGLAYEPSTKTLTLTNFVHPEYILQIQALEGDFNIVLNGKNELCGINTPNTPFPAATMGNTLHLSGSGSLIVNKSEEYRTEDAPITLNVNGNQSLQSSCLYVDNTVDLTVYAGKTSGNSVDVGKTSNSNPFIFYGSQKNGEHVKTVIDGSESEHEQQLRVCRFDSSENSELKKTCKIYTESTGYGDLYYGLVVEPKQQGEEVTPGYLYELDYINKGSDKYYFLKYGSFPKEGSEGSGFVQVSASDLTDLATETDQPHYTYKEKAEVYQLSNEWITMCYPTGENSPENAVFYVRYVPKLNESGSTVSGQYEVFDFSKENDDYIYVGEEEKVYFFDNSKPKVDNTSYVEAVIKDGDGSDYKLDNDGKPTVNYNKLKAAGYCPLTYSMDADSYSHVIKGDLIINPYQSGGSEEPYVPDSSYFKQGDYYFSFNSGKYTGLYFVYADFGVTASDGSGDSFGVTGGTSSGTVGGASTSGTPSSENPVDNQSGGVSTGTVKGYDNKHTKITVNGTDVPCVEMLKDYPISEDADRYVYALWYQAPENGATESITPIDSLSPMKSDEVEFVPATVSDVVNENAELVKGLYRIIGKKAGKVSVKATAYPENTQYQATVSVNEKYVPPVLQSSIVIDGVTYTKGSFTSPSLVAIEAATDANGNVTGYKKESDNTVKLYENVAMDKGSKKYYYIALYNPTEIDSTTNYATAAELTFITAPASLTNGTKATITKANMAEDASPAGALLFTAGNVDNEGYLTYEYEGSFGGKTSIMTAQLILCIGEGGFDPGSVSEYSTRTIVKAYELAGGKPNDDDEFYTVTTIEPNYQNRTVTGYKDALVLDEGESIIRVASAPYEVFNYSKAEQWLRIADSSNWKVTYYDPSVLSDGVTDPRNSEFTGTDVTNKVFKNYSTGEASFITFTPDKPGYYVVSLIDLGAEDPTVSGGGSSSVVVGGGNSKEWPALLQVNSSVSEEVKAAVKAVEDAINALPTSKTVTVDDGTAIKAARSAYDALGDNKVFVSVALVEKLTEVESALAEAIKAAASQATAEDKAAAKSVSDAIAALESAFTVAYEPTIVGVRAQYEALTDMQKRLVTNLSDLELAEKALATLKKNEEEKEPADNPAPEPAPEPEPEPEPAPAPEPTPTPAPTPTPEPTAAPTHTHTADAAWKFDGTNHWHECTAGDGEKMNIVAHTLDSGTVTIPATVDAAGVMTYKCTVCGYTTTTEIAKLPAPTAGATTKDDTGATFTVKEPDSTDTSGTVKVEYTAADTTADTVQIPSTILVNGVEAVVTTVASGAFEGNTNIKNVVIPEAVEEIKENAFKDCTNLETVSIPKGVEEIGTGAFQGCTSLATVKIPDSVTTIGTGAFQGCVSITAVNIPKDVKSLGKNAFANCSNIKTVTFKSNSLNTISQGAFMNCKKLKKITLPKGVKTIAKNAFAGDKNLKNIKITSTNIKSVGKNAFKNLPKDAKCKLPKMSAKKIKAYKKMFKKAGFKGKFN